MPYAHRGCACRRGAPCGSPAVHTTLAGLVRDLAGFGVSADGISVREMRPVTCRLTTVFATQTNIYFNQRRGDNNLITAINKTS